MRRSTTDQTELERITVVSKEFTPAAMEFHRRRMGAQGYAIEGPIVRGRIYRVEGPGDPDPLLDDEECFAVTFIRRRPPAQD